ncbi:hypothetical protein [Chiayiivirga flava]|uniref:Uncharacterized protein n=1 Tax=Chiayiivirga flava TaxID=659595 RepID=A0A7W8G291_9GAMM|nr:hypothetical protein [Chiayiivirga flava]MBB5209708.1 hypothetical protein [Chiayiivirga flava]
MPPVSESAAAPPASPAARLFAALPDAVVSATFLVVWIAPLALGERAVRNALLTMLVEFVLMHASGMLGGVAFDRQRPRATRLTVLAGFTAFYGIFIAAFALAFDALWPVAVFGWLILGKFAGVFARHGHAAGEARRMQAEWAASAACYVGGVFLTVMLPLPRLGMSQSLQPAFGLTGSGVWVDEPHRVVAFGALYFATLAWMKWRARPPGRAELPS